MSLGSFSYPMAEVAFIMYIPGHALSVNKPLP